MSLIETGKTQGARVVAGGKTWGDRGFYVEPTVFADVDDNMDIARQEVYMKIIINVIISAPFNDKNIVKKAL